jgi:Flp pilus assembly protein TadB
LRRFFEWYCRLSPWYKVALLSLCFGIGVGSFAGAAMGEVGVAFGGFLVGLIVGPLYYYDAHRKRRDETCTDEMIDDYPEDLERVERRHANQMLIVPLGLALAVIGASWIIFGTGLYGGLVAVPVMAVASWALGRFGGPNDPKWKRVRDEWKRQRMERFRAR